MDANVNNVDVVEEVRDLGLLRGVSVLFMWSVVCYWFLVNGSGFLDGWSSSYYNSTLIYFVGVCGFLGVLNYSRFYVEGRVRRIFDDLNTSWTSNFVGFVVFFTVVSLVLIFCYDLGLLFQDYVFVPVKNIWAVLLFQIVVVVASEEIIFRGVIFRVLWAEINWFWGLILSSLVFSVFHMVVYGFSLGSLYFAFVMGLVLALVGSARFRGVRLNLGCSMGVHAAWNLAVLGVILFKNSSVDLAETVLAALQVNGFVAEIFNMVVMLFG